MAITMKTLEIKFATFNPSTSTAPTVQTPQAKLWNVYSLHRGAKPVPEYSILLAKIDSTERVIKYDGGVVHTVFLRAFSRQLLSEKFLQFSILSKIYFVATKHPGYYSVLKYYPAIRRYSCSCLPGKRGGHCDCQIELESYLAASPVLAGGS